jgi:predicted nuclease of predicted toxin-antitoxin system
MKFLIDAQLPRRLTTQFRQVGFEVTHTLDLPSGNRTTDQVLISLAQVARVSPTRVASGLCAQ